MTTSEKIFFTFYGILVLGCFLAGIKNYRKDWKLEYKLLLLLMVITVISETCSPALRFSGKPFIWVYHIYGPIEYTLILSVFLLAARHVIIRRLNIGLMILLPGGMIYFYHLHPGVEQMNWPLVIFYFFGELIAACSFFVDALLSRDDQPMFRHPLLWTAFGQALFSCLYTQLYGLKFLDFSITEVQFMIVDYFANILLYGGITITFLYLGRQNSNSGKI